MPACVAAVLAHKGNNCSQVKDTTWRSKQLFSTFPSSEAFVMYENIVLAHSNQGYFSSVKMKASSLIKMECLVIIPNHWESNNIAVTEVRKPSCGGCWCCHVHIQFICGGYQEWLSWNLQEQLSTCFTAGLTMGCNSVVVQSLSCVRLFVTRWTAAHQAPLAFTVSWSLLKFVSIESVILSNYFILCWPFSFCLQSFPASQLQWVSSSHLVAKALELQLQHQSLQWIFRVDFL